MYMIGLFGLPHFIFYLTLFLRLTDMWIGGIAPLSCGGRNLIVLLTVPKRKTSDGQIQRPQVSIGRY